MVIKSLFLWLKMTFRYWKTCSTICLVAFSVCSLSAEGSDLTVMTFNIRWDGLDRGAHSWDNRKLDVTVLIEKYAPDLVALQEASRRQTQYLHDSLHGYESFSPQHERAKYHAILFRTQRFSLVAQGSFWLVKYSDLPGGTRRCAWVRLRETGSGRGIYVYNLHLDGRSPVAHEKSVVTLMEEIRNRKFTDPFLVMGDFNAVETSRSISYLKGKMPLQGQGGQSRFNLIPLVDTVREIFPTANSLGTAHGFRGNLDGGRLDYIFVSEGFEVQNAKVVHDNNNSRYPSDHFPVVVDLQFSKQGS